jgi:hypothetical protein
MSVSQATKKVFGVNVIFGINAILYTNDRNPAGMLGLRITAFGRSATLVPAMSAVGGVSRLCPGVKLAKHFVYGVDDCLRLVQLNLVTGLLDDPVYAMRGEARQVCMQSVPDLAIGSVKPRDSRRANTPGVLDRQHNQGNCAKAVVVGAVVPVVIEP